MALAIGLGLRLDTRPAASQEMVWQNEGPGVAYCRDVKPRLPLIVHVVRISRAQADLEFHTTLGGNTQIGTAILSDQVAYISAKAGQAVAAINGDYFYTQRPFAGCPRNLQILRGGELVSAPGEDRAFFYLDAQGQPHITNAMSNFAVIWSNGKSTPFGLNREPEPGQAVLFTRMVGSTTRVPGVDLILEHGGEGPWLPLRLGQTLTARVRQVNRQGYSPIPSDCVVLSLSPKNTNQYPLLVPGLELKLSTATVPDLNGAQLALGGGPSLVRRGKARPTREFLGYQMRDPRSALGWNNKYYFLVQADGRQPRNSMGMTLEELANYFVKLGCDHALNLDGGGSCTTWLAGKTVNNPAQHGRERPSANALVLVRKHSAGN